MPRTALAVLALFAATLAAASTAGDGAAAAAWDFKSTKAQTAKKRYDEAASRAEQEYARKMGVARDAAAKELGEAMRAATKAGDLDEANRIKQALEELTAELPPPGSGRGLVGRWEVRYSNGVRRAYEVKPDGAVTWTGGGSRGGRGTLRRAEGGWLLPEDGDGNAERWTLSGERLFVEHFHPKQRYPKEPADVLAVGEKPGGKR